MINGIEKFTRNFIQEEFKFTTMKYDISVNDIECQSQAKIINDFFHTNNSANYKRTGREFRDESKKEFALINKKRAIPRTLFQIKHYQNPILGDALKRIVTGNDLYACYVSYPSKGDRELYFSSIFYISETNEGLKIIYEKSFDSNKGVWYHPVVDMDVTTVLDEGELIEIEKYQASEEATSLVDYNKE